jgi:Protein of unknown function (DUF2911)
MNKFLKRTLIVLGVLAVVLFVAFQILQVQTKKASPEATVEYKNGVNISVFYCKPSKKGREIFGGKVVPFSKVWRTGANEATTFTTDKNLTIGGKVLPAGKYTLWTIPEKDSWTIIFNKKQYDWGVSFGGVASREEAEDALQVVVPVETTENVQEQFDISVVDQPALSLILAWDKTKVVVPMTL